MYVLKIKQDYNTSINNMIKIFYDRHQRFLNDGDVA